MRAVIRKGDPTSHGGTVIEGSAFDICEDREIAFLGHKVFCPKCKGVFPIIEGAPVTTVYKKGIALEGMKTACGASLIATQFVTLVACPKGGSSGAPSLSPLSATNSSSLVSEPVENSHNPTAIGTSQSHSYDQHFVLVDPKTQKPCVNQRYRITQGGFIVRGRTDENGKTQLITSDSAEQIKIEVFAAGEEE
jgi:uncharacterized Zn-binding protein involved in type VI secretion